VATLRGKHLGEVKRKVVEAEEFRLVDSEGKLRALIASSQTWDGEPHITLYDRNGLNRLTLELHDDAPRVTFFAPSGQPIAGIGVSDDGDAILSLSRANGSLGVFVRVPANADAIAQVFDKDGQPIRDNP